MKLSQLIAADHLVGVVACFASLAGAAWMAGNEMKVATAPAEIIPLEHRVASTETSRLVSIAVTVGQRVRAGDVLARLDTTFLEREIQVAEAHRRILRAEPAATAAALDADGFTSEQQMLQDISQANADLASMSQSQAAQAAELRSLQQEITRQRQLVKEGLTRSARAEELEVQARILTEALATWPARIDVVRSRQTQAELSLRDWKATHDTATAAAAKQVRLQPSRDRVGEQVQAIELLRTRLASAVIRAPADGEVVSILARVGDVATPGTPFIILHGTGTRNLVAYVNERVHLRAGMTATARRRGAPSQEFLTEVVRTGEAVGPIPNRFWQVPTIPQWGREVFLQVPASASLDNGEALDVRFSLSPSGGIE